MAWAPTVRFEITALVAIPEPSTDTGPPESTPSTENWTVPVGVPPPGATPETCAENDTP